MAGYTRQSTFTDGDIIQASDFNDEYNQLVNVFSNSTGHSHDGTAGEGPVIGLIGDPGVATPINKVVVDDTNNRVGFFVDVSSVSTEQFRVQDGVIVPVTNNDVDLGTSSLQFKDLYLDGTATIDGLAMPTTTVTDILDEDTMSSDSATALATQQSIKAYVDAQLTAQDLDFQGDSGGALAVDLDSETFTIAGGTGIDTTGSGQTLTIDIDSTVATLTGTQTLTNKTLTSAVLNGTISGTSIKDEDDMLSDSADHLATQQSIKAYVDSQITANNELDELTDVTITTVADNEVLAYDSTSSEWINQTAAEAGLATLAGTETLTNKTLTSAVLNTGVSGTAVLDEDNMASDSATQLATQQSIKAYVDTEIAGVTTPTGNELENVVEDTTPQLGGTLDTNGNDIEFGDNDVAIFGIGSDLQIYHDGSDSYVSERGTGNLLLGTSGNIEMFKHLTTERMAKFIPDGAVELYYDNSKKFETTTDGVTVTGKAVADELDVDNITINGNTISSTDTDGDIALDPNGTGNVLLGNFEFDVDQTVGAGQDNYVLTYDNSTGHISLEAAAAGGISDVVSDTTPQLGGNLDVNGNSIVSVSNGNIAVAPDGTGEFQVTGTSTFTGSSTFTGGIYEFDNIRIDGNGISNTTVNPITIEGLEYPNSDGTANQVLTTNGSGTLSFTDVPPDPNAISFAIALG